MAQFIIETTHSLEECLALLDAVLGAGAHYLTHTDWGCEDGVHKAWLIVDSESRNEARLMVPPVWRNSAQLVELNKFTPAQIKALHEQAAKA
ncbi:MAG: hypothetical protein WEE64_07400 [Dehalococcoidia bacterium]